MDQAIIDRINVLREPLQRLLRENEDNVMALAEITPILDELDEFEKGRGPRTLDDLERFVTRYLKSVPS